MNTNTKKLCAFCLPYNLTTPVLATTTITNPVIGRPLPACDNCRNEWDEQERNDYNAYLHDMETVEAERYRNEYAEDFSDPAYNGHAASWGKS